MSVLTASALSPAACESRAAEALTKRWPRVSEIAFDPATRSFACCYLRGDELLAIDCVNNPKDYMAAKKVIGERRSVDPARLADLSVALKDTVI